MITKKSYIADVVTVVIITGSENSIILNRDFLKANKIVPNSWKVTEALSIPIMSKVVFENGFRFVSEPGRILVEEPSEKDGNFKKSYSVHARSGKLLKKLPHLKVNGIGLNCRIIWKKDDANKWLLDRFLNKSAWSDQEPKLESALFKFLFDGGSDWKLGLDLRPGSFRIKYSDDKIEGVYIDCNFHHTGPMQGDKAQLIISTWPSLEKKLIKKLNRLFSEKK